MGAIGEQDRGHNPREAAARSEVSPDGRFRDSTLNLNGIENMSLPKFVQSLMRNEVLDRRPPSNGSFKNPEPRDLIRRKSLLQSRLPGGTHRLAAASRR